MAKMSFEEWMAKADRAVGLKGLSIYDLPDMDYRTMYDEGMSPKAAARKALRNAGDCL